MAKANAVTGTTYYVPEGAALPAPGEINPDIRLVGPGAPDEHGEKEVAPEKVAENDVRNEKEERKEDTQGQPEKAAPTVRSKNK